MAALELEKKFKIIIRLQIFLEQSLPLPHLPMKKGMITTCKHNFCKSCQIQ